MFGDLLQLDSIVKEFPGARALDGVTFSARAGEVHALVGENGAGKSTLIKMIAGVYQPDAGGILYDGHERLWSSPREARHAGIHVIYQELALAQKLTVAENVFLGEEPRNAFGLVDRRRMREQTTQIFELLGHRLDPDEEVGRLTVADQQMVEIAKALVGEVKLLILDEPTAVISGREAEMLFERVRRLRDSGVCVIYVSHRLEEIFALTDRITVLKDGRTVGTYPTASMDRSSLITRMVGRQLDAIYPPKRTAPLDAADPVLRVRDLTAGPRVRGVGFELRRGEILGLAGLVGAGRSELANALFGSAPIDSGTVEINGNPLPGGDVRAAIGSGIGFLTEDRKGEGLMMNLDIAANISAPLLKRFDRNGFVDRGAELQSAMREIGRFNIAAPGPAANVRYLSGGNQQKVLFSRWAQVADNVLILDEPTRGVDVGAKVEIYRIIRQLADRGTGILLISSELPEVIGLCDRVLVMRHGRIAGELGPGPISEEDIMHFAAA